MSETLPRYADERSYQWNYDHPPDWQSTDISSIVVPAVDGDWNLAGHSLPSPLGISAGPLLNGAWCLYYAHLGFDLLTYKTVRSRQRDCYPLPNLVPVECGQVGENALDVRSRYVKASTRMQKSWAVSYGMPSSSPDIWRRDIEWTRRHLAAEKRLCVSVVGSMKDGWGIEELAADYATCAKWAVESGADFVETNFSCPNVSTCDGQLYQNPQSSSMVAQAVRAEIGDTPLFIKIGHTRSASEAADLVTAVDDHIDAIAMTNSIAAIVVQNERELFDGEPRGICGDATRKASIAQVKMFSEIVGQQGCSTQLIGVGGISESQHVCDYLTAGASACQLATSAMLDPGVALKIRNQLQHRLQLGHDF
jgi:dihydroorotate dehydrogenase